MSFHEELNLRIDYAKARASELYAPSVGLDDVYDVLHRVEALGYLDYLAQKTEPPILYSDEQPLLRAWLRGHNFAAEADELATCSTCHDGSGNPCPTHG